MPTVPRLKSITAATSGDSLLMSLDPRSRIQIPDPAGRVRDLVALLAEGSRTVAELAGSLSQDGGHVTPAEVHAALAQFDDLGWLEDASAPSVLNAQERERYHSNLAFFDAFTNLDVAREPLQRRLTQAHVVVLGAGGLGSCVLQSLAGFGVGRFTVLDHDVIELRNFARQFTYFPDQLGQPKVERVADWLRAFHPDATVTSVQALVQGPEDVAALLDDADLLISAIDTPDNVDLWVNTACVGAGVPFIRAGLAYVQGLYWSVDPGRSACRLCLDLYRARLAQGIDAAVAGAEPFLQPAPVNRGIGPVAQVLGGLTALEAIRYLTGFTAPISAATYRLIDFDGTGQTSSDPWPADPGCPVCASAPVRNAPWAGCGGRDKSASGRGTALVGER